MLKKTYFVLMVTFLLSLAATAYAQLPSFADLAEKLLPSVVNISTTALNEDSTIDDIAPEAETLGSGFIISNDGYIVTNQHVIDKAKTINVILQNNEKYEAEIIGSDQKTDLALLKITTNNKLTPVTFGDSDAMRVGDWILAIGNPFGLGGSVTAGIISAKSRDIASGAYDNFIQTDAAINQGNSGGPMFNLKGEVIGINSAIFSSTGDSMGIGFATPSKMAEWVIGQLQRDGKVTRSWIGISIRPTHDNQEGIVITRITENSPAQKAGFLPGDIISKFNTIPINSATNLSRIIAESAIDELLNFEIIRQGKTQNIQVRTIVMPEDSVAPKAESEATTDETQPAEPQALLGLEINNLTPELLTQYQLPENTTGVIITQIDGQSEVSAQGIKVGNVITEVDKKEISDTIGFNENIQIAVKENNRPVLLTIRDSEAEHLIAVKLK